MATSFGNKERVGQRAQFPRTVNLRAQLTRLQAEVAAIKAEPSPIGTVISSLLTDAEISGMTGVWVLCDGRSVAGTAYATLTKRNTVPDLRGSFLRGAGTRSGVTGWAGGALNAHVEDSTRAPRTNFTVTARDPIRQGDSGRGIAGSASYAAGEAYLRPGLNTNRVDGGDPETRPKHFVVNYFIRVD